MHQNLKKDSHGKREENKERDNDKDNDNDDMRGIRRYLRDAHPSSKKRMRTALTRLEPTGGTTSGAELTSALDRAGL